jgi:Rieske Fe-S protein
LRDLFDVERLAMLRVHNLAQVRSTVHRREFIRNAGMVVASASMVGFVACSVDTEEEGASPTDANANPGNNTNPTDDENDGNTAGQGDGNGNAGGDAGNDNAGDNGNDGNGGGDVKPDGVEVKLTAKMKQVGGSDKLSDAAVLKALGVNDSLLLVRVDDATIAANTIACTHQRCDVAYNKGTKSLDCPCHGSRFDLEGNVLNGPAPKALIHLKAVIAGDSVFLSK